MRALVCGVSEKSDGHPSCPIAARKGDEVDAYKVAMLDNRFVNSGAVSILTISMTGGKQTSRSIGSLTQDSAGTRFRN